MNVQEMVQKYLEDNGYDGLYNPDDPCGCGKDDLFPCAYGFFPWSCKAGYSCKLDEDEWGEDQWGFGPDKEVQG